MKEYKVVYIGNVKTEDGSGRYFNYDKLQKLYDEGWEPHSTVALPGIGAGSGYEYWHPYSLHTLVRDKDNFPDLPPA